MGKKSREKKLRAVKVVSLPSHYEKEKGLAQVFVFIIKYGAYLALIAPLLVAGNFFFPYVGLKSLFFMGLAEIIIFAFLGLQVVSKNYRPKINVLALALFILFLVFVLASVLGVNPSYSFWSKFERMTGILMWLHLIGFFVAIAAVFKKQSDWDKAFYVALAVGAILGTMSLSSAGGSTRGGATIGNSSFLGTYLLFDFFIGLYLGFKNFKLKNWFLKAPFFALSLLIFLAVYQASARAATLSILGGCVLLGLFYLAFAVKKKPWRLLGKGLLLLALIAFLAICFMMLFQPESAVRQQFVKYATKSRLVVWEKAWLGFKEKPVLGWGLENFEYVFTKYFNPCMFLSECGGEIWFDRAHNIIFDTLVTSGILGLLAYVFVMLSAFWLLWKNYLKKRLAVWECLIPTVILISYSVQNLTVFDMISSYLMLFLVLAFAASRTSNYESKGINNPFFKANNKQKTAFAFLGLGFLTCMVFFVIQPLREDKAVIDALKSEDAEARYAMYEKAFDLSPLGKFQIREFLADKSYSIIENALANKKPDEEIRSDLVKKELDLMVDVLRKNLVEAPLDFRSALKLSQILNLYSTIDSAKKAEAKEAVEQAVALSPTNQQAYWSLAQTYLYNFDTISAEAAVEQSIVLEPRLYRSWAIAVQVQKFAGDELKAQAIINRAVAANPAWESDLQKVFTGQSQ